MAPPAWRNRVLAKAITLPPSEITHGRGLYTPRLVVLIVKLGHARNDSEMATDESKHPPLTST
jgi:hypothetical protein